MNCRSILLVATRILLVVLALGAVTRCLGFSPDSPVTPGASPEAQSLLTFFADTYGKRVISGQQDGWRLTNGTTAELIYIEKTTGKLPAILALDLSGYTAKPLRPDTEHRVAKRAIDWYQNRHGIPELCCHWRAPMDAPEFYSKETRFDIARAVIEGTPEYAATQADLDAIAAQLEVLRDAHVPVLWRPLHEANGRWFWWGAGGPESFKKLWQMMFENFTLKHHLNNLIWVFSPGAETDLAAWYPGDACVDIIGQDHYPMDGNHLPATDTFNELNNLFRGEKLVALGENGPVPDPALMQKEKAGWLFFTTWSGSILFDKTTPAQLKAFYNNPYVMNLADLPTLKDYPNQPPGKAVKLAFRGAPGNVAVRGTWRMPVTIEVEDANSKTVRTGNYQVTVSLANGGDAKPNAVSTVATVNGLATFEGLSFDKPLKDCQLLASADGLQTATSPAFDIGPGEGLLRQVWIGKNGKPSPPALSEILGKALETPVDMQTNFQAIISGELLAPETGTYQFSVAGGGTIELRLSPDDNRKTARRIALVDGNTPYHKWPHINETESSNVTLQAGKTYYFEIRQDQPQGSTQLHVGWRMPDGTEERPIPAYRFRLARQYFTSTIPQPSL